MHIVWRLSIVIPRTHITNLQRLTLEHWLRAQGDTRQLFDGGFKEDGECGSFHHLGVRLIFDFFRPSIDLMGIEWDWLHDHLRLLEGLLRDDVRIVINH